MARKILSVNEVAEYFGIKVNTVYSWVHIRKIPFIKMGRLLKFDQIKIDLWVEKQSIDVAREIWD